MDLRGNQHTIYGNFFFIFIRIYLISYFTRIYLVTARNPSASPNPTQKGKTVFFYSIYTYESSCKLQYLRFDQFHQIMESSTSASQIHVFPQFRNARSTLPCAVNISGINFNLEIDLLVKFAYTCVDFGNYLSLSTRKN